ncbi:unnamed protein product [Callosobruchus maculatus]|uniref:Uncharacterized protein n=1 Tax=Callosobruchus maculatus TaxID=64391 RepID=A0A653C475_CALMS|nr:unnamed protein product [Callosobruchus maculatus]
MAEDLDVEAMLEAPFKKDTYEVYFGLSRLQHYTGLPRSGHPQSVFTQPQTNHPIGRSLHKFYLEKFCSCSSKSASWYLLSQQHGLGKTEISASTDILTAETRNVRAAAVAAATAVLGRLVEAALRTGGAEAPASPEGAPVDLVGAPVGEREARAEGNGASAGGEGALAGEGVSAEEGVRVGRGEAVAGPQPTKDVSRAVDHHRHGPEAGAEREGAEVGVAVAGIETEEAVANVGEAGVGNRSLEGPVHHCPYQEGGRRRLRRSPNRPLEKELDLPQASAADLHWKN